MSLLPRSSRAGSLDQQHRTGAGDRHLVAGRAETLPGSRGDPVRPEHDEVGLGRLANAFTARPPRLLFLSACHTGENDASVDSLALGLVGLGMPAVLAWADAVYDNDASAFAAAFYREAAHRATSIVTGSGLSKDP